MKSKPSAITLSLILVGAVLATEPVKETHPHPEALQLIQTKIVSRLAREFPPFSRMAPPQPRTQLHPELLVDGEKRLPFEVLEPVGARIFLQGQAPPPQVIISGYMRLKDQAIFVFDTKTQTHIPAEHDPRFAPPQAAPNPDKTKT